MGIFSKGHQALAAEVARLDALKALDDEIKRAGSLERLVGEIEAQKVEAERKLGLVKSDVVTAEATLSGLQAQAEAQREQNIKIEAGGKAVVEQARADAKSLVEQANADAVAILDDAKREGARAVAEAQAWFDRCNKEAAEVAEAVKAARADLAAIEQRKADVEGELARLKNLFKA